jgi:hypothetical protein
MIRLPEMAQQKNQRTIYSNSPGSAGVSFVDMNCENSGVVLHQPNNDGVIFIQQLKSAAHAVPAVHTS